MKCSVCGGEIKEGILEKIVGTYIKKGGKLYPVCNKCQKGGEKNLKDKID